MQIDSLNISQYDRVYFIGIGGIGMSALARYFKMKGWQVGGYDKTPSPLTDTLEREGINIHFEDRVENLPETFREINKTLIVITPAIPKDMGELQFVRNAGYVVLKRAEVLGLITRESKALGVAGTHGKTTTSTMLAHILNESILKCSAFLGGIATNFNSNFVSHPESPYTVIEADEFDRSFLQLKPFASIVTSTDADHLDIYGNDEVFQEGFKAYVSLINPDGFLIRQANVKLNHPNTLSYGIDCDADYVGSKLSFLNGYFMLDVQTPAKIWKEVELGIPGIHNAENALACIAMCEQLGLDEGTIREALKSFAGVKRRFEYHVRKENLIYIDDYAHHPTEIHALVSSIRLLYPDKKITGIFQPHLFSRTKDFFDGFVKELSKLDEVILLPIYPARELPIPGVTSEVLLNKITQKNKLLLNPAEAIKHVAQMEEGVVLTIGAGDIDRIVPSIKEAMAR